MKNIYTVILLLIFVKVFSLEHKGDSLYIAGNLKGAIKEYRRDTNGISSYNIARCYALMTRKNDSVFKYLLKALELDSSINVLKDPDFYSVIKDKRWDAIESKQLERNYKEGRIKDTAFAKTLLNIALKDQAFYYHLKISQNILGYDSPVNNAIWELKSKLNEDNLNVLINLIDSVGWPKISKLGVDAAEAAFLVIQHSNTETREKYISIIKAACKAGEAQWKSYALMYDRLLVNQGKPQIYGSQLHYSLQKKCYIPFPIKERETINKRRLEIGLEPIEDYYNRVGAKWDY